MSLREGKKKTNQNYYFPPNKYALQKKAKNREIKETKYHTRQ